MGKINMNTKITAFTCDKDLTKYTNSQLFDPDTVIATMTVEDPQGYSVDIKLVVTGKGNVINWFELNYLLTDQNGAKVTYDCDIWESDLGSMTARQVKKKMFQAGVSFIEDYFTDLPQ